MRKRMLWVAALVLLTAVAAPAMERFDIVTTEQMKQMLDDRAAGKIDFILVNTLDEIIYRNASIPGSVNLPWYRAAEAGDLLGPDRDKLVITY